MEHVDYESLQHRTIHRFVYPVINPKFLVPLLQNIVRCQVTGHALCCAVKAWNKVTAPANIDGFDDSDATLPIRPSAAGVLHLARDLEHGGVDIAPPELRKPLHIG